MIADIKDPIKKFFAFCNERYMIYMRRMSGKSPPWTEDPILAKYRFCNVYREWDKVTHWIRENWRQPHTTDPDLWFAMCVARLLNRPESLLAVGYPVPWDVQKFNTRIAKHKKNGGKIFNAAYIVSTNGIAMDKLAYITNEILTPLWKNREILRPRPGDTLNSYHMQLGQMHGFGSFMAAQVIADLKYHSPLSSASDWLQFAASGPGSRRGLNYVLGRSRKSPWTEEGWRLELRRLQEKVEPLFERAQMPVVHAQDLQNCLCEFNKWWAATYEDRPPKQLYRGGVGNGVVR